MHKLSIIIMGMDNLNSNVISNAWSISPSEVIVVVSDLATEEEVKLAESTGCKIIIKNHLASNNEYVLGLKEAKGDIVLFLNGDHVIGQEQITSFIQPIMNGEADVVMNNLTSVFLANRIKQWPDTITLWRQVFNDSLGYQHLLIDSLLSMPYALSRQVIQSVGINGFENLAIANLLILEQEWKISRHMSLLLQSEMFLPPQQSRYYVPITDSEREMVKSYLEAFKIWFQKHGVRGQYHDAGRRRDIIKNIKENGNLHDYAIIYKGNVKNSTQYDGKQLSVIIPAQNEEKSIGMVIHQASLIDPMEIIVVVNGSNDKTEEIARQLGATVIVFHEPLGIDVGRSIGALEAKGDILLFIDADFSISATDLRPFCQAVMNGIDVALNNLNIDYFPLYIVNLYKYMLNIACGRKELGVGSIVAVPHALSRRCLNGIGWDSLINPNLAHVKAIMQGYQVTNVHFVDVMKPNRIRPDQHFSKNGHPKAVLRIIGDHLESLAYWLEHS
jgi:hypothetical protein